MRRGEGTAGSSAEATHTSAFGVCFPSVTSRSQGQPVFGLCAIVRRPFTQRQVAQAMGVAVGRVTQIAHSELACIDILGRYEHGLGGGV